MRGAMTTIVQQQGELLHFFPKISEGNSAFVNGRSGLPQPDLGRS